MQVGSELWYFDSNNMVFEKKDGVPIGEPIYSEYFCKAIVYKETFRSWFICHWEPGIFFPLGRIPKNFKGFPINGFYDDEAKNNAIWIHKHSYKILDHVGCVTDLNKLKEIAQIVGYQEE